LRFTFIGIGAIAENGVMLLAIDIDGIQFARANREIQVAKLGGQ